MNRLVNFFRRMFGVPYVAAARVKLKVKNAVNHIGAFEEALAGEAWRHGADGVIGGHIDYATIRDEHGIRYMNGGDWVESCTAPPSMRTAGSKNHHPWTDPRRMDTRSPRDGVGCMTHTWSNRRVAPPGQRGPWTLTATAVAARGFGVEGEFLDAESFRTLAKPSYPDPRLALPYPAKSQN